MLINFITESRSGYAQPLEKTTRESGTEQHRRTTTRKKQKKSKKTIESMKPWTDGGREVARETARRQQ